jgi:uncharacterized phiE125 gp8 family phage protein
VAKLKVISAPAELPVSMAEAKAWMRIDHDEENLVISSVLAAATSWVEAQACRALVTRTYQLILDAFPDDGGAISLPMPRTIAVTNVKYRDAAGVLQSIDPATLQLDSVSEPGALHPAPNGVWPAVEDGRVNPIEIEYTAGYGAAAAVDARAKQAVQLLAAHWFENREALLWHGRLPS